MSYDIFLEEYNKIGYSADGITIINNFMKPEDIDHIVNYMSNNDTVGTTYQDGISDSKVVEIMQGHEINVINAVKTNYVDKYGVSVRDLPFIRAHLTNWDMLLGYEMPLHNDSETPSGKPAIAGNFYRYNITTILYLTDKYVGGNIRFPEFDKTLQPKAGDLVIFPSRYRHMITRFESGQRYTIPMFMTFDLDDIASSDETATDQAMMDPSRILFHE